MPMTESTLPPIRPEPHGADHARYIVESPLEIAALLRSMQRKATLLTAFFDEGRDFILTAVADVVPERDQVVLDQGSDPAANLRALASEHLVLVAHHERIKVQFTGHGLQRIAFGARDAFSLAFPQTLLRLQRREYFRLAVPVSRPVQCVIPLSGRGANEKAELTIVDISCGGVAVVDLRDGQGLERGTLLRDCRIRLPEIGEVKTDLFVHSSFEVTLSSGLKRQRAGCEFAGILETDRNRIQRYIHQVERQGKALLSGLD